MNQPFWIAKLKLLVDIKEDEVSQTFLMFAYFFLVIASHTIVKSIRDALFLNKLGAEQLPYVYIGIALIAGSVMPVYSHLAQSVGRKRLIIGSYLFFFFNIFVFWWLFTYYDWRWMSYVLYIWASIFSAVSTTQFWLAANDLFNPRQAKRLYGFLSSGGTLGAMYPPDSMYNAYRGVTSANARIRANAVELLDSILRRQIKRILFPIIDEGSGESVAGHAFELWRLRPMTSEGEIVALIAGRDIWLKACALYTVGEKGMHGLTEYVQDMLKSPHPLIRESAEFACRKLRSLETNQPTQTQD